MTSRILRRSIPVAVLIGGGVILVLLHLSKPAPEQTEGGPRPVSLFVEPVERKMLDLTVETQGEVTPKTEIEVVAQVSGRIDWVAPNFIAGAAVARSERLVQIEPVDFELAVVQAEARVAQAETQVHLREADAEIARRNWDDSIVGEPTPLAMKIPQLREAQAMLRSAEADLRAAKLALERTRISVPFAGRVREKRVDVGQFVNVGTSLGRVYATDVVEIRLPLTDRQLADLGLPIGFEAADNVQTPQATLHAEVAGQTRQWIGKIARVESSIDPETRVFYAVAEVDDPYGAGADEDTPLAVGLFVTAQIEGRHMGAVLVIPRTALRSEDAVYVVAADNTLDIRKVSVSYSDADLVVVTQGLTEGERVVTSPIRSARQGMTVNALDGDSGGQLASSGD